jgi:hypothetical protein
MPRLVMTSARPISAQWSSQPPSAMAPTNDPALASPFRCMSRLVEALPAGWVRSGDASLAFANDEWAAPGLHSHDHKRNILTGPPSHADELQPRTDVGRTVGDLVASIRSRTVALVQALARRRVEHDEPAILVHPRSMSRATKGGQCRRSSTLRDLGLAV